MSVRKLWGEGEAERGGRKRVREVGGKRFTMSWCDGCPCWEVKGGVHGW